MPRRVRLSGASRLRRIQSGSARLAGWGGGTGAGVLVVGLFEVGQDVDELAYPPMCQRPQIIDQRLVIGEPSLGFGKLFDRRTGADDLGDRDVVSPADGLADVVA